MSSIISLSNSKKDAKAITDPVKRAFIPRLIKSFNPLLSTHFEALKGSSSRLASFDPSTAKKESYLLFTASRFHYFEQYLSEFQFGKNIFDDCFRVLSKHLHFRFAEVASEKIVGKIQALSKSGSQPVQESSETFKVLGDTGVLLELNYKVVHVQLDLQAKRRNWSYVTGEEEQQLGNPQVRIHFVGVFFGILAVYLPPILTEEKEEIEKGVEVSKKEIEYMSLKRELMRFIGVKKSSTYYLVFHKFHLLHRLKYREYSDKYLTQAAVKEGFFGSIGDFFKGAAGTIANGVTKAVQTASNVVDFYNANIKPAVDILTPIVSPYLPDNLRSLLKSEQKEGSKENAKAVFDKYKEARELAKTTGSPVKECLDYLKGKETLRSFQKSLSAEKDGENGMEMGVDLKKVREAAEAFIGKIVVQRVTEEGTTQQEYPALLYDRSTVVTSKVKVEEGDTLKFELEDNQIYDIEARPPGTYSSFQLFFSEKKKKKRAEISELFDGWEGLRFKLDFRENYSSDECFYEALVNKNVFLAELVPKPSLDLQASKVLRCYRQVFYHLFELRQQSLGGLVFYLDEQEQNCHVISFSFREPGRTADFGQLLDSKFQHFGSKNGSLVAQTMKNCSSSFLNHNAYADLLQAQAKSSKELSVFVNANEQVSDENADGESLRTQLLAKKITKSSPLELIGIIAMENGSQKRCGVGLLVKDEAKKPLYFLTLKQNVLYEGVGQVVVRKPHSNEEGPDNFDRYDLNQEEKYQVFQIKYIVPYDNFEDCVFVKLDESPFPSTKRQLNTISNSLARNTSLFGAFYVQFDLSQVYETRIIPFQCRELLQAEQSSYNMKNVTNNFPQKQGIYFTYKKQRPNIQSFLGFKTPNVSNIIVTLPQSNKQNIIIIINPKTNQKIELSKMKMPHPNIGTTFNSFQAVGALIKPWQEKGYASGQFVSFDGSKQCTFILTAAHTFLKPMEDLRPHLSKFKFHSNYTKGLICNSFQTKTQLKDSQIFIHQHYIEYILSIELQTFQPNSQAEKFQRSSHYDIAVIQLKTPVTVQNPLFINLSINPNSQTFVQLLKIQQDQSISKDLQQICVAGFPNNFPPQIQSDFTYKTKLIRGQLYYEAVKDHAQSDVPGYPNIMVIAQNVSEGKESTKRLAYLLSTHAGQSGGPVFNLKTFEQIAVHVGGNSKSNKGCFIYNIFVYRFLWNLLIVK